MGQPVMLEMISGRVWAQSFVTKCEDPAAFMDSFMSSVILRGDSNDVYVWKKTFDPPSGLDSTDPGHFHIHDNDLRRS